MKSLFRQDDFDFLSDVERICPTCGHELEGEPQKMNAANVRRVILGWKIQTGIAADDKEWNRVHFKRFIRPAQELLKLFGGDADTALDCIEDCWERIVKKQGLSLSLEGVVKNSDMFRQKWLESIERRAKRGTIGLLR